MINKEKKEESLDLETFNLIISCIESNNKTLKRLNLNLHNWGYANMNY